MSSSPSRAVERRILARMRTPLPRALLGSARDEARLEHALRSRKRTRPEQPAVLEYECALWAGPGQITYAGKRWRPRALVYALTIGDVDPAYATVEATCGDPSCVEPTHLRRRARETPVASTSAPARALAAEEQQRVAAARATLASERGAAIHRRVLAALEALDPNDPFVLSERAAERQARAATERASLAAFVSAMRACNGDESTPEPPLAP